MSRADASRYVDAERRLCALKIGGWAPYDLHRYGAVETARDRAEGVRLAYVAATRARDLLVVPALGDGPWAGGWLEPLNDAVYPPAGARRTATRGPKCPAFRSKDTVLDRPGEEPAGPATVCPGQHTFVEDGYSVVWWDPGPGGGLSLGARPSFGVRREDLIVKDVPKNVVADGRSRYDRWRLEREDARAQGARPTIAVETVREWSAREPSADDELPDPAGVQIVDIAIDRRESSTAQRGRAFGVLVHAMLGGVSLDADRESLRGLARMEAGVLGLSDAEAADAAAVVENVLRHDVLRRARNAAARGRCRRETPVTVSSPTGLLLEGIVDLAFEEQGQWIVVDYKTDREIADAGEQRYRRQVAFYAAAIARATGAPARGILMRI